MVLVAGTAHGQTIGPGNGESAATLLGATMKVFTTLALAAWAGLAMGCSLITVQQDPFPALQVRAKRPGLPPPRVVLTDSKIEIKDKVQFEYGKAALVEASFSLLDQVAQVMVENPQLEVLQVEGHTDSVRSAIFNDDVLADRVLFFPG